MDFFGAASQNEFTPEQKSGEKKLTGFSLAALVCAVLSLLSLLSLCTGVFAISFGCMGILFVILARRKNQPMTNANYISMCMCLVGIILGISLVIYVLATVIIPMLTDPEAFRELNTFYENTDGVSLEEMLGEDISGLLPNL